MKGLALLLVVGLILSGCQFTRKAAPIEPVKTWCSDIAQPPQGLRAESREAKEWLVGIYMRGESRCGWKP